MGAGNCTLTDILQVVQAESVLGFKPVAVDAVACHPDEMRGEHCLFVCMDEYLEYNRWQTWRTHLEQLPGHRPCALVAPEPVMGLEIPQLIAREPRRALGRVARHLAGYPDRAIPVYGVTGTNGKTTTTRLLAHLLGKLGQPCGSIGTLGVELAGRLALPGTYTTPLAPQLHADLAKLRASGAGAAAMEVSSHGLALDRVEGIEFAGAILTNVERDHLDFHGTPEAYVAAKQRLFQRVRPDGWCVLNRATPHFAAFAQTASGKVLSYGPAGSGADLELAGCELHDSHSAFRVRWKGEEFALQTRLVGQFQIENAMAALTLLLAIGHAPRDIARALEDFESVCGRMERIPMANGCTAIVDYAHNPDGLKHVLENCRLLCRGRLHVVFGCGGDRDRGKRPLMGALAASLADVAWVTSDNPRTEDPGAIIADILEGMRGGKAAIRRVPDRAQAIREAYAATDPGDVLVVAGKGHEDYQLIGYTKYPFSDQAVLRGMPGP